MNTRMIGIVFGLALVAGSHLVQGEVPLSLAVWSGGRASSPVTGKFARIVIKGSIGALQGVEGVSAGEFTKLVQWAEESKLATLELFIDSQGGSCVAKDAMVRALLGAQARGLRTIATVKRAEGISALLAFACAEIRVLPGATFAGGIARRRDPADPAMEKLLGAKLMQDFATAEDATAELSAADLEAATRFRRPQALLKAMFASQGLWEDEKGELHNVDPAGTGRRRHAAGHERYAVSGSDLATWKIASAIDDEQSLPLRGDEELPRRELDAARRKAGDAFRRACKTAEVALKDLGEIAALGKSETKSTQASRDARKRKAEEKLDDARKVIYREALAEN